MIRNWNEHRLDMDFSGLAEQGKGQPSDIDMFYLGKNRTLIVGEIKNSRGVLRDGQRRLLEHLCDGWRHDAICLYITHDRFVQMGDTSVDVAECYVTPGPIMKRVMPRAQGRAYRILKRTSHITVVLKEQD